MTDIARLLPRLSTTERLILDLLRESELFGLQLHQVNTPPGTPSGAGEPRTRTARIK